MTDAEAKRVAALVATRYPVPAWSEDSILLYAELIADLDYETTKAAAMAHFKASPDRLDVADLRRAVLAANAKQGGAAIPAPDEAWGQVVAAIRTEGNYGDPAAVLHPLVLAAVDRMGWRELCLSENGVADRAHFLRLYEQSRERAVTQGAASDGARLELPVPSPRRIERRETLQLEDATGDVREMLRDLNARLAQGGKPEPVNGKPALPPPVPLREPTPAELDAAEKRRAKLREQLVERGDT